MLRRMLMPSLLALRLCSQFIVSADAVTETCCMCRRAKSANGLVYVYYSYGVGLSGVPGAAGYVSAYDNAAANWDVTPTPVHLHYSSTGSVSTNTVYDRYNGNWGWMNSWPYCTAPGIMTGAQTWINRYIKERDNWSWQRTQQVAAHELGHALGMAQIVDARDAVMCAGLPDPLPHNYLPRDPDIELLNQIY
jgi:hypothetical protein